jgi:predicted amidohydrolase
METKIACAQFVPHSGDTDANLDRMASLCEQTDDSELVIFPELAITGYLAPPDMAHIAEPLQGPLFARLREIAGDTGRAVATGFAEKDVGTGNRHNTLVVVDSDGNLVLRYRKTHLWRGEELWAEPGTRFPVAICGQNVIGGWICYDTRFPEVARLVALAGAQTAVVASAWLGPASEWELAVRSRAMDNNMFVAAAALQGHAPDGSPFRGGSLIVGPSGEVLASAEEGTETVISAVIDLSEIIRRRERMMLLRDRRVSLYGDISRPI